MSHMLRGAHLSVLGACVRVCVGVLCVFVGTVCGVVCVCWECACCICVIHVIARIPCVVLFVLCVIGYDFYGVYDV